MLPQTGPQHLYGREVRVELSADRVGDDRVLVRTVTATLA
jgi:hypothetical protein